jgi:DNA-directed RNA polymerase specialized sigma24 family protein
MVKMRIFHYDPSRRFRGWLFRLFSSRAIDLLRKRTTKDALATRSLNDIDCLAIVGESADPDFEYAFDEAELLALIQISEQVRDRVRARVSTENWTAFELIALRDQSIKDVSQLLGKSYTATYTAYRRVDRLLREEGRKQLASGSVVTTPTDALLMGSHARPRSPRTSADRF